MHEDENLLSLSNPRQTLGWIIILNWDEKLLSISSLQALGWIIILNWDGKLLSLSNPRPALGWTISHGKICGIGNAKHFMSSYL